MTPTPTAVSETARSAPVWAVGGLTLFGVGISDWVLLLSALYTLLQTIFLIRDKWYYPWRASR
jgi:hypothetical protein